MGRLNPGVRALVDGDIALLDEPFRAKRTLERPLPRVGPLVPGDVAVRVEPLKKINRSADAEGAADATASSPSIATIVAAHPARVHTDTLSREMKAMIKVQGNQSHHIARYCGSYCILQRTTHHEHSRFCPPPRGPAGRGLPDVERCRGGGAVHPARHHLPPLLGTHVSSRESPHPVPNLCPPPHHILMPCGSLRRHAGRGLVCD